MIDVIWHWAALHSVALRWLVALSLLTFFGTLVLVPILVARIPADYFQFPERHRTPWAQHHPLWRAVLLTAKNFAGAILLLLGIAMLVLPGQGLLTIAIGVALLDFPGKYQVERWLVSRAPLLRAINALRHRAGRAPLVV